MRKQLQSFIQCLLKNIIIIRTGRRRNIQSYIQRGVSTFLIHFRNLLIHGVTSVLSLAFTRAQINDGIVQSAAYSTHIDVSIY